MYKLFYYTIVGAGYATGTIIAGAYTFTMSYTICKGYPGTLFTKHMFACRMAMNAPDLLVCDSIRSAYERATSLKCEL